MFHKVLNTPLLRAVSFFPIANTFSKSTINKIKIESMDIVLVFVVDSEQVFTLWLGRHLSDANLVSHNVNITHFKSILNFYTF